jgi:hypothetical protein
LWAHHVKLTGIKCIAPERSGGKEGILMNKQRNNGLKKGGKKERTRDKRSNESRKIGKNTFK